MKEVVASIIEAVRDDDGVPRIDVVVATHRHKDHVSGFANAMWNQVEVKEVWMPWTETPDDPEAARIRESQAGLAVALQAGLTAPGADTDEDLIEMVGNALSNESAMATLHEGFRGKALRRFLPIPAPEPPSGGRTYGPAPHRTFTTDVLPGVTIHVMGPSRDEDLITQMDPPRGKSYLQYLAGLGDDDAEDEAAPLPFARGQEIEPDKFEGDFKDFAIPADLRKQIQKLSQPDLESLAASLDSAVNGTSLMLMLKVGKAHLLLPGDAQWGTWKAALEDPEWRALLEKTDFYKVGHHGSHNATPREFVEEVLKDKKPIRGMVSVRVIDRWKDSVPRVPLLEALEQHHHRIVRSDQPDGATDGFSAVPGDYIETRIPI
jgi:beta-lactamase superfamily II metal-dependent hydrolase